MADKELEKKAEESYAKRLKDSSYYETGEEGAYICGYIAGAKELQEENQQLKQRIEKMVCCGNCNKWYDCSREKMMLFNLHKNCVDWEMKK